MNALLLFILLNLVALGFVALWLVSLNNRLSRG